MLLRNIKIEKAVLDKELAVIAGLFITALLARLPWLWEVPRYIDELQEVNLAYSIYRGESLPLHNMAHDIGAMHNYILAGIFKVLGSGAYLPRLYVAVTSAITVVLIYYVGKKLYGKWTGIAAAVLLLGNGMHILVTHMAWANCTTPFFFSLAFLATIKAEQGKSGRWLAASGLLWALTLQTHSSAIIYVLVAALYVLKPRFREETGIGWKYYLLAAVALTAGYSNMLYYNLVTRGGSIAWLSHKDYAMEGHPGIASYAVNLQNLFIELIRSISSTYIEYNNLAQYWFRPAFAICFLLLLIGAYYAARHKQTLPIWMIIGSFLIIPWVNQRYLFFLSTRYIMPVVLMAVLLMAYGLVLTFGLLHNRWEQKRISLAAAGLLLMLLTQVQLMAFYGYCWKAAGTNMSNRLILQTFNKTSKLYQMNDTVVIIDNNLKVENNPLPILLTLSQIPYQLIDAIPPTSSVDSENQFWSNIASNYEGQRIVGVMSADTFSRLRSFMDPQAIDSYSCRVTFPPEAEGERKIYVVDMGVQSPSNPVFAINKQSP